MPGDVLVPAALARPLARLAVLGARGAQRDSGGLVLVPGMAALLAELAGFAGETAAPTVASTFLRTEVTAREGAELAGLIVQRVRTLARAGRIRARRVGREWLIDPDGLPRRRSA